LRQNQDNENRINMREMGLWSENDDRMIKNDQIEAVSKFGSQQVWDRMQFLKSIMYLQLRSS
jgi:hypothetical protein